MKTTVRRISDHWRDSTKGYASQWGYRCGSEIAKLIDHIREEYRAKYAVDYHLRRIGKNQFVAIAGDNSSFGVSYAVEASKLFKTSVVYEKD